MKTSLYGTTSGGHPVEVFTLRNANGLKAEVIEYGAILASMKVPDRDGIVSEITLNHQTLGDWEGDESFLGATVGRFGNRIARGKFTLDSREYSLATNNEPGGIPCHLHGGEKGFNQALWKGEAVSRKGAEGVRLTYRSVDGEEGYPGNLDVVVSYWLSEENELTFYVEAGTDAPTPVNIVNHTYWNLGGDFTKTILDHELQVHADHYLATDAGLIPTGERAVVKGTPMDFTELSFVGERIEGDFEALKSAGGYDHCWILREGEGVRPAAKLHDPKSGRSMEVFTDQPGVQFYAGNFLCDNPFGKRTGLCLEAEGFPDAPNQADFPNSILRPGEVYEHTLVFRFLVD